MSSARSKGNLMHNDEDDAYMRQLEEMLDRLEELYTEEE